MNRWSRLIVALAAVALGWGLAPPARTLAPDTPAMSARTKPPDPPKPGKPKRTDGLFAARTKEPDPPKPGKPKRGSDDLPRLSA